MLLGKELSTEVGLAVGGSGLLLLLPLGAVHAVHQCGCGGARQAGANESAPAERQQEWGRARTLPP